MPQCSEILGETDEWRRIHKEVQCMGQFVDWGLSTYIFDKINYGMSSKDNIKVQGSVWHSFMSNLMNYYEQCFFQSLFFKVAS